MWSAAISPDSSAQSMPSPVRGLTRPAASPTRTVCSAVVGELFNAGSGEHIAIGRLAEDIACLMGVQADIIEDAQRLRPKDSEVMRLVCDASKLRQRTGWQPRCSRDEGLRRTIEWFRAPGNLERYNPSEYSQ